MNARGVRCRLIAKRRFTRQTPRPREWVGLHAAALAREPALREAFVAALQAARSAVNVEAMQVALERLSVGDAIMAFSWPAFERILERGILDALRDVTTAAAVHAAHALERQLGHIAKQIAPPEGSLVAALAMRNPRLEAWLAAHGAELVHGVTLETQLALRQIVLSAARRGVDVRDQAARIATVLREGLGLTIRQARALANLDAHLVAEGVVTPRREQMLGARRERMITQRSKLIARTETMIAAGRGQQEAWLQARELGLLDDRRTRRRWLAQPEVDNDNPCPICAGMHEQVRSLEESFVSTYDGTMATQPPAHPACLCTVILDLEAP